jgi:hypothetical protein
MAQQALLNFACSQQCCILQLPPETVYALQAATFGMKNPLQAA